MSVCRAWAAAATVVLFAGWSPPPAKYEIGMTRSLPITMRDGVVLRADVYHPVLAGKPAPGPFPVLLSQTPYSKQAASFLPGVTGYEPDLVRRGYIHAIVEVRGTGSSGGTFELFGAKEAADSAQVIEWASKLPNSTGRVGMTGQSYVGINQLFAAAEVGPGSPLKAVFAVTASNDAYREIITSGGLFNFESIGPLGAVYPGLAMLAPFGEMADDPGALAVLGEHSRAMTDFTAATTLNVLTDGDRAYDEEFWQARNPANVLTRIVRNGIPAYLVGGLWDVYQEGAPRNYAGLQNAWARRPASAPMQPFQRVTGRYQLLMKRAYHTGVGGPDLEPIRLAWFERWLKGEKTGIDRTRAPLHVVQARGGRIDVPRYPLRQATPTPFYLAGGGALTRAEPAGEAGADTVVFTGASLPCDRSTEQWALGVGALAVELLRLPHPCADGDTVPQSAGPGQLVYETQPFRERTVLAGPIAARLFASANTRDTEWVVKISDVAPDGRAVDITQGALLGSLRKLDEEWTWRTADGRPILPHPHYTRATRRPVVPGEVTTYDVDVRPAFTTIEPGHRLRLTILTSQLPHLVPNAVQQSNLLGGVYRVQRRRGAASYLLLPLAPASAIGPNIKPIARASVRRARGRRFRLDARRSLDRDGRILSYRWTLRSRTISRRPVFTRRFPMRTNRVRLTVIDDVDAVAVKTVRVPRR